MTATVTTDSVWSALEDELFAVLAWNAGDGSPRSAGIVYVVRDRCLYVGTGADTWKARQIAADGRVSVTVTIPKRIPLLPWLRIPAATITFRADAEIIPKADVDSSLLAALTRGMTDPEAMQKDMCVVALKPQGDFLTYGIGVSLREMMDPTKAQGRTSV